MAVAEEMVTHGRGLSPAGRQNPRGCKSEDDSNSVRSGCCLLCGTLFNGRARGRSVQVLRRGGAGGARIAFLSLPETSIRLREGQARSFRGRGARGVYVRLLRADGQVREGSRQLAVSEASRRLRQGSAQRVRGN